MLIAGLMVAGAALGAAVPIRGVVEGYYGRPWGTEGRLSLLEFMGENGLNTLIYGPKDDPYHHGKWREEYPAREQADFKKLLEVARKNRVDFYWAIHLGGAVAKEGAAQQRDFADIFRKLESMYAIGFRCFAVFFDDFGDPDVELHALIANRILREFLQKKGDCRPLIVCPNIYWSTGDPYQKAIGEMLDPAVLVFWTGPAVCSELTPSSVATIAAELKRPPLVWWNWPVTDYRRDCLLLGRTYGLVSEGVAGIILNPMENCEANKIALKGFADWARDPEAFDSEKDWEASFDALYPDPEIAAAMRVFATHNSSAYPNFSAFDREESAPARRLLASAADERAKTGRFSPVTEKRLGKLFVRIRDAAETLLEMLPAAHPKLFWEIEGWLQDERMLMEMALLAIRLDHADEAAENVLMGNIRRLWLEADAAGVMHVRKFAAATFEGDHGVIPAKASNRYLRPFVEEVVVDHLRRRYARRTGRSFGDGEGLKVVSSAAALANPVAERRGKEAGLKPMLETVVIAPGESFLLQLPANCKSSYFHARFEDEEALKAGVVEISKDAKSWKQVAALDDGVNAQLQLPLAGGWRFARYRNLSAGPVRLKALLFKFDVEGETSLFDSLMKLER